MRWHRATVVANRIGDAAVRTVFRLKQHAFESWIAGIQAQRAEFVKMEVRLSVCTRVSRCAARDSSGDVCEWHAPLALWRGHTQQVQTLTTVPLPSIPPLCHCAQDARLYHELCLSVRTFYHWRDATLRSPALLKAAEGWRRWRLRLGLERWAASVALLRIDRGLVSMAAQQYQLGLLGTHFRAWRDRTDRRAREREAVALYARHLMRGVMQRWSIVTAQARHWRLVELTADRFWWITAAGRAFAAWRGWARASRQEALAEAFRFRSLGRRTLHGWQAAAQLARSQRECAAQAAWLYTTKVLRRCMTAWRAHVRERVWREEARKTAL